MPASGKVRIHLAFPVTLPLGAADAEAGAN